MYSKHYLKKKTVKIYLLTAIFSLFLGLISLMLYKNNITTYQDSSLTGDEILENKQSTIPQDVQQKLQEKNKVLGSQISGTTHSVQLPESFHIPILMYHYVEYVQDKGDTKRIALNTNPYTLEQEILTLQGAGYTFMTNGELTDAFDGKKQLPPKPIVLTFDDGYRDFYIDAYPILKKYHVKATQYVIAGFLDKPNHLLTSQLLEIANDGLVEIGAHTVHHMWLKGRASATVEYEVTQSKKMLEDIIHKPVVSFAYPYGAFDQQAIDLVHKAGFSSATSTIPGIDQPQTNRYFLYRLRPGGRTGKYMLSWLDSINTK